jgi:hypothetical protein
MKAIRNLLIMALILSAEISIADDPGLPGGDPDVPIDGGVVILVIAGLYYGIRNIRNEKDNDPGNI